MLEISTLKVLKPKKKKYRSNSDESLKSISDEFPHSAEKLTYDAFCKHQNEGFKEALKEDYPKAYKANSVVMWSKSQKKIIRDFLTKSKGSKPIYKKLLLEDRDCAYNHSYVFSFSVILLLALFGVLPGLFIKIISLEGQFEKIIVSDLATLFSFAIVAFYILLAIRLVEAYTIKVICFEHRAHFKNFDEFKPYLNHARKNFYPKSRKTWSFAIILILIALFLISVHFAGYLIEEIGFQNSFYLYVGDVPLNENVNSEGFLITTGSLIARLWFEAGWALVLLCMFGLVPYVIQMLRIVGDIRKFEINIDFFHPDGAAGFKAVSSLLIWIEFLGVILVAFIQACFIFTSIWGVYQYSSIALIPLLDISILLVISALFAIFPFAAAIVIFIYPLKELKSLVSSKKRAKLDEYSKKIKKYETGKSNEKKDPDVQFYLSSYNHVKSIPDLFNYSTQLKTSVLPFLSLLIPILTLLSKII